MDIQEINEAINLLPESEKELISDGYHSFKELYDHRVALFVALVNDMNKHYSETAWKSKLHADGTMYDGWFIAGIGEYKGDTLTYHLPMNVWDKMDCRVIERAPKWDGHTSEDVLRLLYNL